MSDVVFCLWRHSRKHEALTQCYLTKALNCPNSISSHLKLCLAAAIHNFKWVKIAHVCLIWDQAFANIDV